jgi:hypothetical protein
MFEATTEAATLKELHRQVDAIESDLAAAATSPR